MDYVLSNPAVYVGLEHRHGVSPIATMKNNLGGREYALFGGVIFTPLIRRRQKRWRTCAANICSPWIVPPSAAI